ncbi:MAG: hypothetical protein P0Y49_12615 [Candidatus Pedobacter colombiensis]|uniref:Uncharacterized protein n=1 Tax=Candidatus Pedobacter colombiensis TaxID=3121371 RepID=A0AAJ5W5S4_9SPHI|nr:hypothetical protein [Pedobacter sp.]WEK17638.1 MAG: hypothetical protein P0Y49_12615 [Pedobacter sp.]
MQLILLLCFLSCFSFGQINDPIRKQIKDSVLFKGVNKLVITNDKSLNQNLFLLQSEFMKRGYTVIVNRKQFTVSTRDSLTEHGTGAYVFNGHIISNGIELSGKYNVNVAATIFGDKGQVFKYDIEFLGAEKAMSKRLFFLLMDIAKSIEGEKIYVNETRKKRGSLF